MLIKKILYFLDNYIQIVKSLLILQDLKIIFKIGWIYFNKKTFKRLKIFNKN